MGNETKQGNNTQHAAGNEKKKKQLLLFLVSFFSLKKIKDTRPRRRDIYRDLLPSQGKKKNRS
jgi:hypothetical protein